MKIFISGSDTNIGKTLISAWICNHSTYDYFKPIQTGCLTDSDSVTVKNLSPRTRVHSEAYRFELPLSPHLAAKAEDTEIDISNIHCPSSQKLIIEGAGGLLVPINDKVLMIDLIQSLQAQVILVVSSKLGTINHSLLSIEALRARKVPILGVIVSGTPNQDNADSIQKYGQVEILAQVPNFNTINPQTLQAFPLSKKLKQLLDLEYEKLAKT